MAGVLGRMSQAICWAQYLRVFKYGFEGTYQAWCRNSGRPGRQLLLK
jgi:hypothetical protein